MEIELDVLDRLVGDALESVELAQLRDEVGPVAQRSRVVAQQRGQDECQGPQGQDDAGQENHQRPSRNSRRTRSSALFSSGVVPLSGRGDGTAAGTAAWRPPHRRTTMTSA